MTRSSSPSTSPVAERVHDLVQPALASVDVELVDVEWTGGTLRISVDQGGGISTQKLTEVNRVLSPLLDEHDPVPGRYLLEVSSPGVERPLRTRTHFERAVGEDVTVKLVPTVEPRRIRGRLIEFDGGQLIIEAVEIDGVDLDGPDTRQVALDDVAKARTVFDWDAAAREAKRERKNAKKTKQRERKNKGRTPPAGHQEPAGQPTDDQRTDEQ